MTQQEAISRLSRYQSDTPSAWREDEEKRLNAKKQGWLQYSRKIAIKVALAMQHQNISRQELAERLKRPVSYISKMLKGEINFSLDEICTLENALNVSILQYEFA
jgi:ribosome-binding protein aMBF1 (putative translation factor)